MNRLKKSKLNKKFMLGYKKNRYYKFFFFLLIFFLPVFLVDDVIYALSQEQQDKVYYIIDSMDKFFTSNSIIQDVLRTIGWGIICVLKWLVDACISLYKAALDLFDFSEYILRVETNWGWSVSPKYIALAILTLSLLIYGVILIIDHKKKSNIFKSILLFGICMSSLYSIMSTANTAVKAWSGDLTSNITSDDIINDNFYDLLYIDKKIGLENLKPNKYTDYHYGNDYVYNIDTLDVLQVVNYDSEYITTDMGKEIFSHTAYTIPGDNGEQAVVGEIDNGWGWQDEGENDFGNEFYYRYYFDFIPIVISLVATMIVYICISYKIARLIFELPFKRMLALFYAADVNGQQKTLKILGNIKDTYIIIMVCAVLLNLFKAALVWCGTQYSGLTYAFIVFFISCAVIDGPNIIQALTGEDAGLSSGFGKIYALTKIASGSAKRTAGGLLRQAQSSVRHGQMLNSLKNKGNSNLSSSSSSNVVNGGSFSSGLSSQNINDYIKNGVSEKNPNDKGGKSSGTNNLNPNKEKFPDDKKSPTNSETSQNNLSQNNLSQNNVGIGNNLSDNKNTDSLGISQKDLSSNADTKSNLGVNSENTPLQKDSEASKINASNPKETSMENKNNSDNNKKPNLSNINPANKKNSKSSNDDIRKGIGSKKINSDDKRMSNANSPKKKNLNSSNKNNQRNLNQSNLSNPNLANKNNFNNFQQRDLSANYLNSLEKKALSLNPDVQNLPGESDEKSESPSNTNEK